MTFILAGCGRNNTQEKLGEELEKKITEKIEIKIQIIYSLYMKNMKSSDFSLFHRNLKIVTLYILYIKYMKVPISCLFYRKETLLCILLFVGGVGNWQNFFYEIPKMGGYFIGPTKQARLPTTLTVAIKKVF